METNYFWFGAFFGFLFLFCILIAFIIRNKYPKIKNILLALAVLLLALTALIIKDNPYQREESKKSLNKDIN